MNEKAYFDAIGKNECLLDLMYPIGNSDSADWLDNFSLCDNYVKKYLFYRFQNDGVDVDVCEYAMPLYTALSSEIFSEYDYVREEQERSKCKYELLVDIPGNKSYLRGDTAINAMSAIQQIFEFQLGEKISKPNQKNRTNESFRGKYKYLVEQLEKRSDGLLELLNTHVKMCYSLGNFYPLIFKYGETSLNSGKANYKLPGYLSHSPFGDVMSCWLKEMKNCLCESKEVVLESYRNALDSTYSFWVDEYKKRNGWISMVEDFCFQPFLDENNEPITFWRVTQENFLDDFKEYLKNINHALERRRQMVIEKMCATDLSARCNNLFES